MTAVFFIADTFFIEITLFGLRGIFEMEHKIILWKLNKSYGQYRTKNITKSYQIHLSQPEFLIKYSFVNLSMAHHVSARFHYISID